MIKRNNMRMTVLSMSIGLALLTGCGGEATSQLNSSQPDSNVEGQVLDTEVSTPVSGIEVAYNSNDYYADWKDEEVTHITLSESQISAQGNGVEVDGSTVTINNGGTYVLSGVLNDGQVIVDSQDKEIVRLILNGTQIHSSTGAPIYVKQAEKTVLSLEAGTSNKLSDSANYVFQEGEDEPNSTLFSKDDLTINGTGSLTIEANYNNAITCKDELKIMQGTINISAVGDGIKGKDMVAIKEGIITIDATEDGIKSTNSTDSSKGFIYIEGGSFDITAGNDGIQAETDIKILDGDFKLNTGGGSSNGASHTEDFGGGFPGQAGGSEGAMDNRPPKEGMTRPTDEGLVPPPGTIGETNTEEGAVSSASDVTAEETSDSYKGIKATHTMTIEGGIFKIDSADDALHSNNSVVINEGEFAISSGDDGIHADTALIINGGNININKCYEGLEAADITVAGGKTYITASDDGVNAADGTSETTMDRRPGASVGNAKLTISNGYLYVDANGDGLDANGSIYMTGGTTIINGPTNGGNGALDYDNVFEINGGTLIAVGSSQMTQSPSDTSTQKTVAMTFANNQEANSVVAVLDESGNLVMSFAPSKTYQSVIISSPSLEAGKTYSFSYGGTISEAGTDGLNEVGTYTGGIKVTDFTISDVITYLSESGVTTGTNGFHQQGGMRPNGSKDGKGNRESEAIEQANNTI